MSYQEQATFVDPQQYQKLYINKWHNFNFNNERIEENTFENVKTPTIPRNPQIQSILGHSEIEFTNLPANKLKS